MKVSTIFYTILALFSIACTLVAGGPPTPPKSSGSNQAMIARGKYLTTICACNDCHTPKIFTKMGMELDTTRMLSGHMENDTLPAIPAGVIAPGGWGALTNGHLTGWAGPWGKSFARNLTPDTTTGLGSWTEAIFIKAIRTGKDMGEGRPILPPMPWEMYRTMTDDDLTAIFAYLKSLPPIANATPDPIAPSGERMPTMHMK
jgi:cytochrome c553